MQGSFAVAWKGGSGRPVRKDMSPPWGRRLTTARKEALLCDLPGAAQNGCYVINLLAKRLLVYTFV